jgi:hypothetical protein
MLSYVISPLMLTKDVRLRLLFVEYILMAPTRGLLKQLPGESTSWFIPPIVIPAFLVLLVAARAVYLAF